MTLSVQTCKSNAGKPLIIRADLLKSQPFPSIIQCHSEIYLAHTSISDSAANIYDTNKADHAHVSMKPISIKYPTRWADHAEQLYCMFDYWVSIYKLGYHICNAGDHLADEPNFEQHTSWVIEANCPVWYILLFYAHISTFRVCPLCLPS